jgi:hypothetical protein
MNDHDQLDELLSARLDGEATDADVAAVADDPAAAVARGERLRAAASAIGAPVDPPSAGVRDAAIGAALDAFRPTAPVVVTDLEAARRERARRRVRVLSIAAAVVVAIAVPLVAGRLADDDPDDNDVAASFDTTGDEERAPAPGAATTAMFALDLGEVADADALVAAVQAIGAEVDQTAEASTLSADAAGGGADDSAGSADACLTSARRSAEVGDAAAPTLTATARFAGEPVLVYVFESAGSRRAVAVAPGTCLIRADVALPD